MDTQTAETPETPTLILATVDTQHFHWQAAGRTEEEANLALLTGWLVHAGQTDADPDLMRYLIREEEVNYLQLDAGAVYRDGSPLTATRPLTHVHAGCGLDCRRDATDA